ncbi:MAG: NAD(P)/FAD-dependent oxidoreductase [Anaerotruncus sp.]|nr:NAD(P)/FAD-dependent oxidoreductase [Anaerotruncus sp.]
MNYLIAGNGPAAVNAVKAIRRLDPSGGITMVSPEENLPYSRIMVPEYLTGEMQEEDLYFAPEFYEQYQVQTRLGKKVQQVLPREHQVVLDDGEQLTYDRLLLATGSRPFLPPWADLSIDGVYCMWDKADAEKISAALRPKAHAVVVGGGLVGMQAARALSSCGMKVCIVELADRLMVRQLDETAAELLRQATEDAGVQVRLSASVEQLETADGKVCGVRLANGERLAADCVIVSAGVRPNLEMLEATGIEYARGIQVDERLHTALPDIYAAGDVVKTVGYPEGESAVRAIWLNAVEQGEIAGENMAGGHRAYAGGRSMNSTELFGLSLISAGCTMGGEGLTEKVLTPALNGAYCKVILDGERLLGMQMVGDVQQAGLLVQKIGLCCNEGSFWGKLPTVNPELIAI